MKQCSHGVAIFGLLLGLGTAVQADEAADAQAAVEALRRMGGECSTGADKTALKVKFGCHAHINPAEFARIKALKIEEFECIVPLGDAQLEDLRGQTGLRKLVLNSQDVTDAGLAHLKTLSSLRELVLRRSAYTAEGLCDLAKGLEKLEKLRFTQGGVTDDGLKCVGSLPALRELSISGSYSAVSDKGLAHLAGAKKLRSLSFYRAGITDEGLKQLQGLTELEELKLVAVAVTDTGLALLKGLRKLRSLTIDACPATAAGIDALRAALPDLGFISLFNGKDLTGWKANEAPDSFKVEDGKIVVYGPRSHLFYTGDVKNHVFKNFEFKADVLISTGECYDSGIYFHTELRGEGWPDKGFQCQIARGCGGRGGPHAIKELAAPPVKANEWFEYHILVKGKKVQIRLAGNTVNEWTQPEDYIPPERFKGRILDKGTFALKSYDWNTVWFKNIRVKPLDD